MVNPKNAVGKTVNGPTSITQLWNFENVAKICQFQFLDPPPPNTHTIMEFGTFSFTIWGV